MESPKDRKKVLELFKEGPNILENAIADLSSSELDYVPSKGGWSIRQIIHHLVDGDDLWKIGIKTALGGVESEFTLNWYTALPQTDWAVHWSYENRSIDVSLNFFKAIRSHVLQMLEHSPDGWTKSVKFANPKGEIELVPVGFIVQMQVDHVEHHVKRILEIREELSNEL